MFAILVGSMAPVPGQVPPEVPSLMGEYPLEEFLSEKAQGVSIGSTQI